MEYKIFKHIRNKIKIPFFIRFIFSVILVFLSLFPIILPLFPGSLFLGIFMLVVGMLLLIDAKKIRHVVKLRKSIIHLFTNLHKKQRMKQKINDIKIHILDILDKKR